ncbi:MAG: beta-ketoacyl synthase N-terminal-like domain-containing protein, partial [Frankia sp.]
MPEPTVPDPLPIPDPPVLLPVRSRQLPVAVVGIGSLTPGAVDSDAFWRTVVDGRDLISDVPPTHWLVSDYYDPDPRAEDMTYSRRGAFLADIDFDPSAYGIAPSMLPATDTAQLLALFVADRTLADLRRNSRADLDRERVSVILGTGALDLLRTMSNRLQRPIWLKALRESGMPEPDAQAICDRIAAHYVPWQEATFPGVLGNVVAGRIANRFDLHGTNLTVDAACASSLAALAGAVSELAQGTADTVITGGVDTLNDISTYMCFSKTPALSRTGDCRPFSDAADGTMLGEAVVMFALKRLADAERDGDRIYAVIRGIGSSSDGRGGAIYAPVPAGQARALRRAYEAAGYGPDSVELVESHGTGTTAGDLAEFSALREVFDASGRPDRQWCALGSVKSQLGHTKSAAGAVGLLKAVLALQHKVLPPTIKVDRPNPALDLASSPLYVNTVARPWITSPSRRRRASVSSFGFGGTNFHVTLEEYEPPGNSPAGLAPCARAVPTELVLLSATSPLALLDRARSLACADQPLAATARQSQRDFDATDRCRLAVVAADAAQLADRIRQADAMISDDPAGPHTTPTGICYRSDSPRPGRIAWLFSGQGSQYVGMGGDLAMGVSQARAAWDRMAELRLGDRPLHQVVFPIPGFTDDDRVAADALLTATEWAQPALAAASLAQLSVLRAVGMAPDCVAGHSFGELVALHAAGVMDETSLVRLARRRGEVMRSAAIGPGAMLAVSTSEPDAARLLRDAGVDEVWIANVNSPRQVVLAGKAHSIAVVAERFSEKGIATRVLPAAGAFHTPLMAPAQNPLREFLRGMELKPPKIDVYGNADAHVYPVDTDLIRDRVAGHLLSPVAFVDEIEAMYAAGVRTFVELGAGTALAGLVGQTLGDREHLAVSLDRPGRNGLTALQEALGKLATAGIDLDLMSLWSPYHFDETPSEPQPARMSVRIGGANYGSPYPPAGGAAALPPPNPSRPVAALPGLPAVPAVSAVPAVTADEQPMSGGGDQSVAFPPSPAGTAVGSAVTMDDPWLLAFQ